MNNVIKLIIILTPIFFNCKSDKKVKLEGQQVKSIIKEKDSIYFKNQDLVVEIDGQKNIFKSLNKQAMSLSTTLVKVNSKMFYLLYDYSGSSTKMIQSYCFIFNNKLKGVFLLSKETIKFYRGKVASNKNYFKSFKLNSNSFDDLEQINEKLKFDFLEEQSASLVNLFLEGKKIGVQKNNYKSLDRFLSFHNNNYFELSSDLKFEFSNLILVNDLAFYLERNTAYKQAIIFLNNIIKSSPNRTVAYINLGDAYWGLGNFSKAKQVYKTYIEQMKANRKEAKIPKQVLERVK